MTREQAERLVAQLLAAPDGEARQALIVAHADDIGPLFFEILGAQAPEELAIEVARSHLALRDPQVQRHLELAIRLLEADIAGDLDAAIAQEWPFPDQAAVSAILDMAEASVCQRADLSLGRRFLDIAARLIGLGGYDALRPALALGRSSLGLLADDIEGAERELRAILAAPPGDLDPLAEWALSVNLGLVLLRQGRAGEAAAHYEGLIPRIADTRLRLSAQADLGLAYRALGRTGSALAQFRALVAACADAGQEDLQAKAHGNLALLYERLGLAVEEERELRASHELAVRSQRDDRPRDWHAIATACFNLCLFHLRRRDVAGFDRWLAQYRTITRDSGLDPDGVTQTRLELERLIAGGKLAEAAALARVAVSRLPRHRRDEEAMALIGSAGRALLVAGDHRQAAALFAHTERLAVAADHHEFRHAALGYRAVALLALGQADEAGTLLDAMTAIDTGLRRQIDDPLHQFTYGAAHEALYDAVIAALIDAGDARRLFDALQGAKAFAVGRGLGVRAGFGELAARLPQDAAFLEYVHRGDRSVCLIARAGGQAPDLVRLDADESWLRGAAAPVDGMAAAALVTLRDPDRRFDGLAAIAGRLLHPVLDRLEPQVRRLVVAPAGPAIRLPFHLFPLGEGRVIDRYAVSYVPSAAAWLASRDRARPPRDALVIGHGRDGDPPLSEQGFRTEAAAVAATLVQAGLSLRPASSDGSRADLLRHLDADILHVAVHGGFDSADPMGGRLVLSAQGRDAPLALETLARAETTAAMVVLSGCDTGRVVPLRNQEALGLMSVLLSQRVAAAVLSFWPVPATGGVAATMMTAFHRAWLIDGLPPDLALRRAMLEAGTAGAPLHAWGGFGLFGYGGPSRWME